MRNKRALLLVSVTLAIAVISVFWIYFGNRYSRVVVGEMQVVTVEVNSVEYFFVKEGNILGIFPYDESHYPKNAVISPQEGETYQWLGIEITIAEVYVDRFVLNIKSRS
jgi:hypothetical protein